MIMIACVSIHVCTRHRQWGLHPQIDYKLRYDLTKTQAFSSDEIWKKMAEISYKFPIRFRTAINEICCFDANWFSLYLHSIERYKKHSKFVFILWLFIFNVFILLSFFTLFLDNPRPSFAINLTLLQIQSFVFYIKTAN